MSSHSGSCFCGQVSYKVTGKPTTSSFCHCTRCQRLTGSAFIWTIHFPNAAFKWTSDASAMDSYATDGKPYKTRYRCSKCGACVASYNANTEEWSVWGSQLERDSDGKTKDMDVVRPTAHTYYGTRLVDVNDGLGKWEGYEGKSAQLV
ncbi:Mss4-like protein [Roridomyces roridus]|uniref:Mss4-like protein n=1 Tax=Roridomyces roridus TaxID=1738132 RepID=A0AAD7FBT3_9AGAR|nr:Mss4-like protein [Roridomyces roridus]